LRRRPAGKIFPSIAHANQRIPSRYVLTAAQAAATLASSKGQEGSMVRDLQIMTVGLVFLFLGAIVVGVF
jgi:hypothetical protein